MSASPSAIEARALAGVANLAWNQADYDAARALHSRSLEIHRALGNRRGIATALGSLGLVALDTDLVAEARALFEEALGLFRELGDDLAIAKTLGNLALVIRIQGDPETSRRLQLENLAVRTRLGDRRGAALAHYNLVVLCLGIGDVEAAQGHLRETLSAARDLGDKNLAAIALDRASEFLAVQGNSTLAVRLRGAADAHRQAIGRPVTPLALSEREQFVSSMRAALGDDGFEHEWEAGRRLRFEDAVACSLEEIAPASRCGDPA